MGLALSLAREVIDQEGDVPIEGENMVSSGREKEIIVKSKDILYGVCLVEVAIVVFLLIMTIALFFLPKLGSIEYIQDLGFGTLYLLFGMVALLFIIFALQNRNWAIKGLFYLNIVIISIVLLNIFVYLRELGFYYYENIVILILSIISIVLLLKWTTDNKNVDLEGKSNS